MAYVLVIITVFSTANAIATDTRFQEYESERACFVARDQVKRWFAGMKGAMAREVYAECSPKR